jgi:TIR domain-containing protein
MTQIFVSHSPNDAECVEQLRQGLEAKGYTVWREPASLSMESILYPRTIENDLLRSAAIVLVWSSSAAQSEWVERHILFGQRLKKMIVPVVIDGTGLPTTLIVDTIIKSQVPCTDVVTHPPPDFPSPNSTDPLIVLSEQAAHEYIRERKAAIDQAAEMLQRGEHREEVLAILEYLAQNDLMMGVRDKAQEVLHADTRRVTPVPPSDQSHHIFGVRCPHGHISYFDKRRVCSAFKEVPRDIRQSAGIELDELHLKCDQCGVEVVAREDCRGYK